MAKISSRHGEVVEGEGTVREVLERAVAARQTLFYLNLHGQDLRNASLRGAVLEDCEFLSADLSNVDLRGASVRYSKFYRTNLRGADLRNADLTDVMLLCADLEGANLEGANMYGVSYLRCNFVGANLAPVRDDVYDVLRYAPNEVPGLLSALRAGRIDGSTYTGECACLVGTIAHLRNCEPGEVSGVFLDANRPAEKWFYEIRPGQKPSNSQFAKLAEDWIESWMKSQATCTE